MTNYFEERALDALLVRKSFELGYIDSDNAIEELNAIDNTLQVTFIDEPHSQAIAHRIVSKCIGFVITGKTY